MHLCRRHIPALQLPASAAAAVLLQQPASRGHEQQVSAPHSRDSHRARHKRQQGSLNPRRLTTLIKQASSAGAVLQLARRHEEILDHVHIATCLHRLASLLRQPGSRQTQQLHAHPDFLLLCELAAINAHKFDAQGLGNVIWALAALKAEPPRQVVGELRFLVLCCTMLCSAAAEFLETGWIDQSPDKSLASTLLTPVMP